MTYSARRHRRPPPRRRRRSFAATGVLLIVILAFGALGFGTVATNAFGAGDLFDRLVAKVDRVFNPVPERSTRPTVEITAPPTRPTASPGGSPAPSPSLADRAPVDVKIVDDPEAVFAHEARKDWCAPAGVQMTLAVLGKANTSEAFQRELHSRVREWESKEDSRNGEWGPAAMALALDAYGAPGYEIGIWWGVLAPAGVPAPIVSKLNSEINAILQEPEIAKRIETAGLQTTIRSRAETAKMFRTEIVNWSKMVEAVGSAKSD